MYQSSIICTVVLHDSLNKSILKENSLSFSLCTLLACQWGNYVTTFNLLHTSTHKYTWIVTNTIYLFIYLNVKVIPQQGKVAQGVLDRLRPRIFLTFGTTRVVGQQRYAPTAFTPGEIPGTPFQRLSWPQGTWFYLDPWKNYVFIYLFQSNHPLHVTLDTSKYNIVQHTVLSH